MTKEKDFNQTLTLPVRKKTTNDNLTQDSEISNMTEDNIKKKYENAIKMLWANKYEQAEQELLQLKQIKPVDLMPNIQYWLGEVYYAKKNFSQAVIEFGEGFSNYPDSIKGPDNLLKLGLSFSNLNKKNEACSAFYELEVKYKNSPKNVLERSQEERKKLDCPKE
ncbi:MAG: tetratricopeptide repeat protein [Alphaproteobacteria bacterium]